jgi:hypothetical protein
MSGKSLKDKLKDEMEQTGTASLSSKDMANFTRPEESRKPGEDVKGDVKVDAPKATADPMIETGAEGDPGRRIQEKTEKPTMNAHLSAADTDDERVTTQPLVITEAEREAFLDALVSGQRLVVSFSLFNDRITGKFRCRTQEESYAIIQQLSRECREKHIENALEYSTRLRNMLLTAQVAELNGEEYALLEEPLLQQVSGAEVTKPGWMKQVDVWGKKDEGLISALYAKLQEFERKYWMMVDNADDQNFWNPEESTSE